MGDWCTESSRQRWQDTRERGGSKGSGLTTLESFGGEAGKVKVSGQIWTK